jgi:hypothetical protein
MVNKKTNALRLTIVVISIWELYAIISGDKQVAVAMQRSNLNSDVIDSSISLHQRELIVLQRFHVDRINVGCPFLQESVVVLGVRAYNLVVRSLSPRVHDCHHINALLKRLTHSLIMVHHESQGVASGSLCSLINRVFL